MDLKEFQERLVSHYAGLRDVRAGENYHVYAIEHGLSADERSALRTLLNAELTKLRRADEAHWLAWIAAAAEIGYSYDGTEYWDSFETVFPLWRTYGSRNRIRDWYRRFAAEYRGLKPSGPWAGQFRIIAWPITQAILPVYLQRHFSDHLFELRYELARRRELTLDQLGDLLSDRYVGNSSRFEGFLQQKALTARIVMAMGLEHVADAISPIERETLERITEDIDGLGQAGKRLREARRVLRETRFVNSFRPGQPARTGREDPRVPSEHGESPRLIARQEPSGAWSLFAAIPDLATPLRQCGLTPHELDRSRMRYRHRGSGNPWSPARGLFAYTGRSEEPIAALPDGPFEVFEFDRSVPKAEAAIRSRTTLSEGAIRLLKVRTDGTAVELAGRQVRSDHAYVIASTAPLPANAPQALHMEPLPTTAVHTQLWRLVVPKSMSSALIDALGALGLGYALSVRLEPVGLSPRWDRANGALSILDTEEALFILAADLPVSEYRVEIDDRPPVRLRPSGDGRTLLSLGRLDIGAHKVVVSALGVATGKTLAPEELLVDVRPASAWQQAIVGRAGISFVTEPRDCRLDELLDRVAHIQLRAPPGRCVKIEALLHGADGQVFRKEPFGHYATPIADDDLTQRIIQRFTANAQADSLERAARVDLTLSLDEYGTETISFEKAVDPLRWIRKNEQAIRLADDTGGDEHPHTEYFSLTAVDAPHTVTYEQAREGVLLQGRGGLLVARYKKRRYAAVATVVPGRLHDLSEIGIPVAVSQRASRPDAIINALMKWRRARRLIGPMAFVARQNALVALEERLEELLCGSDWARSVARVRSGTLKIGDLYRLVFHSPGFASGLCNHPLRYNADEAAAEAEFLRHARLYKVSDDAHMCRLALKLAFQPYRVKSVDLPTKEAFRLLRLSPALIRGAYFARLAEEMRPPQSRGSEAA